VPAEATNEYLPVLMLMLFAISFTGLNLVVSWLLGKRGESNPAKDTAFECGMAPFEETGRKRFGVRFYVVAMLFILFDVEVVFLYPWAIQYKALGMFAFVEMLVFLAVLFLGWVYVVRKGALDWHHAPRPGRRPIPRPGGQA